MIIVTVSCQREQFHSCKGCSSRVSLAQKPAIQRIMKCDAGIHEESSAYVVLSGTRPCSKASLVACRMNSQSKLFFSMQTEVICPPERKTGREEQSLRRNTTRTISCYLMFVYGEPTGRVITVSAALMAAEVAARISLESSEGWR